MRKGFFFVISIFLLHFTTHVTFADANNHDFDKKQIPITPIINLLSNPNVYAGTGLKVYPTETGWVVEANSDSQISGLKIIIPQKAITSDLHVSVSIDQSDVTLPDDFVATNLKLNFEPDGANFKEPIFIEIPYSDDNNDGIVDGTSLSINRLEILVFDHSANNWVHVDKYGIDSKRKVIIGQTTHFSLYVFGGRNDSRNIPFNEHVVSATRPSSQDIDERIEFWEKEFFPVAFNRYNNRTVITFVPNVAKSNFAVEYLYDGSENDFWDKTNSIKNMTVNDKAFEEIFARIYEPVWPFSPKYDAIWVRDGRDYKSFSNANVEILAWNPNPYSPDAFEYLFHSAIEEALTDIVIHLIQHSTTSLIAPVGWLLTAHSFVKTMEFLLDKQNAVVGVIPAGGNAKHVEINDKKYFSVDIDSRLLKTSPVVMLDFVKDQTRNLWLSGTNKDLVCYTSYGFKAGLFGKIYDTRPLLTWEELRQLPDGRYFVVKPKETYSLNVPSQELIDSYGDSIYGTTEGWISCNLNVAAIEENESALLKIHDWFEEGEDPYFETVISAGQTWMDRNLGASRVAISKTDSSAYGYYYQWGRGNDGHQYSNSSETSELSNSDNPSHNNFIISNSPPYDWRSPQNNDLWQGVTGVNNPCPNGFRVPTETELNTERASWSTNNADGAFASPLKLVKADKRDYHSGYISQPDDRGLYWSSTILSYSTGSASIGLYFGDDHSQMTSGLQRADACSIRCIKD